MSSLARLHLSSYSDVRSQLGIVSAPQAENDPAICDLLISRRDTDYGCEPAVLDALYGLVKIRRPITVVEIGTYKGVSARVMCAALQSNEMGRIYTIDDGRQCPDDSFASLLASSMKDGWAIPIRKSSANAFVAWGRARIDLLFLDGSHDFLSSCTDFSLWSRYLSRDGLIVVHDTYTRMERRFPEDYIYPLEHYDIVNIERVEECYKGHEWEGCAFIFRSSESYSDA